MSRFICSSSMIAIIAAGSGGGVPDISGYPFFAWYDFSDLSTLFQDSAGTIPVAADGDPIGKVVDKSGNGHDLTQATAAARPTYRTSGGLHWADFDGSDDVLLSSAYATIAQPNTLAVAAKIDTNASSIGHQGFIDGNGARNGIFQNTDNSLSLHGGTALVTNRHVGLNPFVAATVLNGASSTFRVNGAPYTLPSSPGTTGSDQIILGRSAGSGILDGRIYGVTIFDTSITDTQLENVEEWLASKSGVTELGANYALRLRCSMVSGASNDCLFTEVEMRTSYGGADQTGSGGSGGSGGWYSVNEGPDKAFDNSTGTWWQPRIAAGAGNYVDLIYYFQPGFTGPVVEVKCSVHGSFPSRSPTQIVFAESYDGGETWEDVHTETGLSWTTAGLTFQWFPPANALAKIETGAWYEPAGVGSVSKMETGAWYEPNAGASVSKIETGVWLVPV